jgi:hypothetical protein
VKLVEENEQFMIPSDDPRDGKNSKRNPMGFLICEMYFVKQEVEMNTRQTISALTQNIIRKRGFPSLKYCLNALRFCATIYHYLLAFLFTWLWLSQHSIVIQRNEFILRSMIMTGWHWIQVPEIQKSAVQKGQWQREEDPHNWFVWMKDPGNRESHRRQSWMWWFETIRFLELNVNPDQQRLFCEYQTLWWPLRLWSDLFDKFEITWQFDCQQWHCVIFLRGKSVMTCINGKYWTPKLFNNHRIAHQGLLRIFQQIRECFIEFTCESLNLSAIHSVSVEKFVQKEVRPG